jgi:hypothetical protein
MRHDAVIFSILYLAAGLFGGIVRIFFDRKIRLRQALEYIIVGAIAGNFFVQPAFIFLDYSALALTYIAPQLLDLIKLLPPGFVAFVIGMGGLDYCRWLNRLILGKLKQIGKTKNE